MIDLFQNLLIASPFVYLLGRVVRWHGDRHGWWEQD